MPITRRQFASTSLSLSLALSLKHTTAQSGTPEPTPPEECLSVETFPVGSGERPHDVAPAADGRIWYTGQNASLMGLLDPATGEIERIPLGQGAAPHGVIVGPDDAAWITDGGLNAIVRVDAESKELTVFPVSGDYANLNTAAIDAEGNIWFTGQSGIVGRVDPESGQVDVLEAPRGRGPYGIDATPEGDIWFVSLAGSYLGRLNYANGAIEMTTYDPPTEGAGLRRVWSDSKGVLWIAEWNAGQVARFDPSDESWQEWKLPGDAPQAYAVYVDERDDVWLTDFGGDAIVRFDPETETFVSVSLPDAGGNVRQLLGRPGELWGAESGVDKLIVVRTACES
jgi:virginiamycin B lyase